MMLLLCALSVSLSGHHCGHNAFQAALSASKFTRHARGLEEEDQEFPDTDDTTPPQKIRIKLDLSFLTNISSSISCTSAGQTIEFQQREYFCSKDDIVTESKREVIVATMQNAANFISEIVSVIPINESFDVLANEYFPQSATETDGNTDLYVTVYPRPFQIEGQPTSSQLALAGYIARATWLRGQPCQGIVNVNLAFTPGTAQDFNSTGDRMFFETLVHELCHVLGISGEAFGLWINPETGKAYGEDPVYSFTKDNKVFSILNTSRIHALLVERWGQEFFDDNESRPVGLELEDTGGNATAGSHWEGRTYYTELMTGTTFGYLQISNITLTALEDTGWYTVDKSRAEPLFWGDYKSIVGATRENFSNFAVGRPVESFPEHYLVRNPTTESAANQDKLACTFDHRAIGGVRSCEYAGGEFFPCQRSCTDKKGDECQYPGFYDPNNGGFYGYAEHDYLLVPVPANNGICSGKGRCARTAIFNATGGDGHLVPECLDMECTPGNRLKVYVGELWQWCNSAGEILHYPGLENSQYSYLFCPDPAIVCGILNYPANSSATPEPDLTQSPLPSGTESITSVQTITSTPETPNQYPSSSPFPTLSNTAHPSLSPVYGNNPDDVVNLSSTNDPVVFGGEFTAQPKAGEIELVLAHVTVDPDANILAVGLVVTSFISLVGNLKAADDDKIVLRGDDIRINAVATEGKLPVFDLGAIGSKEDNVAVPTQITVDVAKWSSSAPAAFPVKLVGGRTLHCESWISKVTVNDAYEAKCIPGTAAKQLAVDAPEKWLAIDRKPSGGPDSNPLNLTLVIGIAVAVVVVVIIIVVVCACRKKGGADSSADSFHNESSRKGREHL